MTEWAVCWRAAGSVELRDSRGRVVRRVRYEFVTASSRVGMASLEVEAELSLAAERYGASRLYKASDIVTVAYELWLKMKLSRDTRYSCHLGDLGALSLAIRVAAVSARHTRANQ